MDKNLNELLKWGIENSTNNTENDPSAPSGGSRLPVRSPNADVIAALLGGPSDADLMKAAVENITSSDPEITLDSKLIAFDNLEQLIESLDNANLLSKLGLWSPLLELLGHDEPQMRLMAAWCVGTAVQNNAPCQERLVALGGIERLLAMALGERVTAGTGVEKPDPAAAKETKEVRRKAVYALSSACRNYQPAMDVLSLELGKREGKPEGDKVEATDMEAVNAVIDVLREKANSA
ncbi:putative Hsp70 nucleotide exchange factor [Xylariales sp. PMI_506]|nr:putative Hsp70 nucleotide exchange factor [Xylariales sp. PMI_506]